MTASVVVIGICLFGVVFLIRFLIALYQEDKKHVRQVARVSPYLHSHVEIIEIEDADSTSALPRSPQRTELHEMYNAEDGQQLMAEYR